MQYHHLLIKNKCTYIPPFANNILHLEELYVSLIKILYQIIRLIMTYNLDIINVHNLVDNLV